jgi:phosphoserine phosphatase
MDIGVFLDVDKTLTSRTIQEVFAERLHCSDVYRFIERDFQLGTASAEDFGGRLVELFAERGLTLELASEFFAVVERRAGADEVLALPVTKYLVSTGPDYYVNRLAANSGIPLDNVICSTYHFEAPGGAISSCEAVSDEERAEFVRRRVALHDLTIGVGDSPTRDTEFIDACTLSLLTVPSPGHLFVPDLRVLRDLVVRLAG